MNILHYTPSCHPQTLGTARRLDELLRGDGNRHIFVAPSVPGLPPGGWERHENFAIRRCRCFSRLGPEIPVFSRYLKAAVNRRLLGRLAPPEPPALVHAHSPLEFALAGGDFARRRGLPLIYEIHTLFTDEVAAGRRTGVPYWFNRRAKDLARFREGRVVGAARAVIVQTEAMRARVEEIWTPSPGRVAVVPNGIDCSEFDPLVLGERRGEFRRSRGWEGKTVVLYGGYLDRINGVDFLLDALAGVSGGGLKLVLAGAGPLESLVRARAAAAPELIEFAGRAGPEEMRAFYGACDVVVVPRPDTEAGQSLVPIKLLEAMAMGKIVLASDLAALSEALGSGEAGIIFRRGDREDFRGKLLAIAEGPEAYSRLGNKARDRVLAFFNWERSRSILRDLYREIAPAAGRTG